MSSKLFAFTLGVAVGAAVTLALLPNRRERLREIRTRLGEIDGFGRLEADAQRFGQQAISAVRARYLLAREEALRVRADTEQELWSRFETARREGTLPPG